MMKAKAVEREQQESTSAGVQVHLRAVRYMWRTTGGETHHGRTVVSGRDKRDLARAERRFWKLHAHVAPVLELEAA